MLEVFFEYDIIVNQMLYNIIQFICRKAIVQIIGGYRYLSLQTRTPIRILWTTKRSCSPRSPILTACPPEVRKKGKPSFINYSNRL